MSGKPVDQLGATVTDAPATPRAAPPRQLGKYRIERELGAGAMGIVHAAYDPELDRRVALKVVRVVGADARSRLLREARAMAKLTNPNVVVVYEVGTVDNCDYVAMELIEGVSLADWLRGGRRRLADRLDALVAAGRGLAAAHAAGLVHRDFKPHNVLCGRDGRILVTDFGLARTVESVSDYAARAGEEPSQAGADAMATLTRTGSLLGTPAYMAPEQWHGKEIGPATDQFAFCVALWEALAGTRPFTGASFDELRAAVERGPAGLDASRLPRRLRPIVRRGLDPDPARRWPSMTAVLGAIARDAVPGCGYRSASRR